MPGWQSFRGLRPWQVIVLVVAWLAATPCGYVAYERVAAPAITAPTGQIVAVQRGTLVASISTTGTVIANAKANIAFKTSGRLTDLLVNVGDTVKPGQALAKLDATDVQIQGDQAQAQLNQAQAKLELIQQGSRPQDIAAAAAGVASAQSALAKVQAGATDAELQAALAAVASAKSSLTQAQANLTDLQAQPRPEDVKSAQLQLQTAKNSLWATQVSANNTCDNATTNPLHVGYYQCTAANQQATAAQNDVESAQANLDKVSQPATAADLQSARQAVTNAQAGYDSAVAKLNLLQQGSTAADVAAAQSTLVSANGTLALKQTPYTAADIQSAQAAVTQAEVNLALAQSQIADSTLVAPYAGTIAAINMNLGEVVGSGSTMTLVDPKSLRIDAAVDESDIAKVALGQPAQITFDALPGQTFAGKVIAYSPNGTVQSGVVTYIVSLSVDNPTGLKPGMTANVSIVYRQKDDVLMVPNRAIRAQGRDRVVDVVTAKGTIPSPVQVGLSNDQVTEITGGLQGDEQVMIAGTATRAPRVNGVPGIGGGIGGGFGR